MITAVKKLLNITLLAFLFINGNSQVTDDFTDGNFTINPVWTESAAGDFKDTLGMLRSNNLVASSSYYITTPSTVFNNCQWELFVNLQFATSSANYVDVYLTADNSDLLAASLSGYFVRIGNTTDEISLYKNVSGTVTEIIDGLDGIVASSSNNLIKIKVVRDASNQFTLERDMSGTGSSYTTEGIITDAALLSSSFFGILIRQSTSSFFKKHFFDDVYAGPIILDTAPPTVISATAVSSTQLDVLFDENVEQTTAETATNYSVNNGIGTAATATRDGGNFSLVHLTFATPFTSGQNYTLTVTSVQDMSGNAIVSETENFSYLLLSTAAWRDVIINEIFADPSPIIGLPDKEFIEIYNRSSNNFDLSGWTFSDGTTTSILSAYILSAGDYLILCSIADTASFSPLGNVMGLSSWPSLNNTGDNLSLKNNSSVLIDQVNYLDDWYQDAVKDDGGWTLELINPTLPCSGSNNWIASVNSSGGTPGAQNSVYNNTADTQIPVLTSVTVVSQSQIQLVFNESMDSLSLANAVITLSNGLSVTSVQPVAPDFTTANIFVSPLIDSITAYTITVSNATDCSGNTMNSTAKSFGIGVSPAKFEVVINEIYADPDGSPALPNAEFVEVFNTTTKVINLNGLLFSDAATSTVIPGAVVFPNGYLILCASADENMYTNNFGRAVGLSSWPSLNNSGDSLSLRLPDGTLVHSVNYSDDWYADATKQAGGWTLETIDPANPCGEENNWKASVDPDGGTPGGQNSIYTSNPDNAAPQLIAAEALDSLNVLLTFNEIMDSVSVTAAIYSINNGITIGSMIWVNEKKAQLVLSPATYLQYNVVYTATVTNCSDCVGNLIGSVNSAAFALPEQAQPGDLIINEVLFNPRGDGDDFVEIYNNSSRIISLKNWQLANYSNDTIANNKIITTNGELLFPGEYVSITTSKTNIESEYPLSAGKRYIEMTSMPSYSNTDGRVVLITNSNTVSDDFSYTEEMHFALLTDAEGVSLERLDFNRPTSDVTNWHSAAEAVNFGTPGYENSQQQDGSDGGEISLDPATFSPDNDGYNDVLNIHYEFADPGMVANVTIYDAMGRMVKLLVRNELLGNKGTFTWDGINEKREKSNVGMYVVYFEVFSLDGKLKKYKKPFVLATKF